MNDLPHPCVRHSWTFNSPAQRERQAERELAYIDAIADNPESLIEALQNNHELAFHLCEFVAWALDFRHANAPDELLRIAGMVDREIRKSAEEQS